MRIINATAKAIKIPDLRSAAVRSLWAFANNQLRIWQRLSKPRLVVYLALLAYGANHDRKAAQTLRGNAFIVNGDNVIPPDGESVVISDNKIYGTPIKKYTEVYEREYVKPVIDRLCKDRAIDPDDVSGRNTLRNRAEMEVRYNDHLDSIQGFKDKGVKLVIASTHADCSTRCRPWQGRVYSLDGTRGKTADGREYIPLEEATDIYYTTKAGKTYKNGLLGFNCRHYLMEYHEGMKLPTWTAATQKKEYALTLKQREYERDIRRLRINAVTALNGNEAKYYTAEAKKLYGEYEKFSKANGRAFYPWRTRI